MHEHVLEICEEKFISKKLGLSVVWIAFTMIIALLATSVGWAMTKTEQLAQTQTELQLVNMRLDLVNTKLDGLMKSIESLRPYKP